ncbi:HORMA domain-containing protein [Dactylonectria macrodidyma]|uniref:HORMA domain-containing protein n=1 Tax=Dactylonectria macrodidyma TaxID=307937 RepID=A0A9P9EC02_9HYPO|nr:HORMA domain-containing protein [Dactylonectria macrodidyma]
MSTSTRPSKPASAPPQTVPIPSTTAATLLDAFTTFLTLALHSLLYHRGLYPPATFLTARALNLPVRQSRHPGLCAWINDAVAAAAVQLRAGTARRVVVAMHAPKSLAVLERWVFDVEDFPASWGDAGEGEAVEEEEQEQEQENDDDAASVAEDEDVVNWTDVNEALRGALRRIAYAGETMPTLPGGSTFTLAVELRDEAPAPIGHPQPWIPSQPKLQPPTKSSPNQGSSLGGSSTTPIRSVRAGPLFFECWVELGPDPPS